MAATLILNDSQDESLYTVASIQEAQIIGSQPHRQLTTTKRWIVFEDTEFKKPMSVTFLLANQDPFTVAYCLKVRDRTFFLVNEPYGILKPGASAEIRLTLRHSDFWSRGLGQLGSHHQIAVENLHVSERVVARTLLDGRKLARDIFKRTTNDNPQQRLYFKINVILKKKGEKAPEALQGK